MEDRPLIPVPETVDPAGSSNTDLELHRGLPCAAPIGEGQGRRQGAYYRRKRGIGTALLQLGKMAGLKMYGLASKSKQHILTQYGAMPIDYRGQNFVEVICQAEPDGIDVVLDGLMRVDYIRAALPLLQRSGRLVSFGEPSGFGAASACSRNCCEGELISEWTQVLQALRNIVLFSGRQTAVPRRLGHALQVVERGQKLTGHCEEVPPPRSSPGE